MLYAVCCPDNPDDPKNPDNTEEPGDLGDLGGSDEPWHSTPATSSGSS